MSDDMNMPASEEFDFANDGIQAKDITAQITDFEIVEKENGTQHVLTFSGEDLPYQVKVRAWVKHSNPVAERIGRSELKKIAKAATGEPRYSASTILNTFVKARMGEDKDGFLKLSNFKPAVSDIALG